MLRDPNWGSVKRANASTIVDILAVPESQVRAAGRLDGPIRQSPRLPFFVSDFEILWPRLFTALLLK